MEESLADKTGPWLPPAASRLQPARRDHGVRACIRGSRDRSGAQGLEHLGLWSWGGVCVRNWGCASLAHPALALSTAPPSVLAGTDGIGNVQSSSVC